jgi:2-phosphosulfolactate phosphatase
MRVWAELGEEGATRAAGRGDVVVVVDALRASVTITAALAAGVRMVIPVQTVEEAMAYRSLPGFLVAGERNSLPVPGFDFGNSPGELLRCTERLAGQVLVLTTSHGTRCVESARRGASEVLVGSLPNVTAVTVAAHLLAGQRGCDVSLVAAGTGHQERAKEDDYAVALLAAELASLGADISLRRSSTPAQEAFLRGPHGRRLVRLGYGEDVDLCARLNIFDVVGVLKGEGFVAMRVKA